jgi:hypothetical protein
MLSRSIVIPIFQSKSVRGVLLFFVILCYSLLFVNLPPSGDGEKRLFGSGLWAECTDPVRKKVPKISNSLLARQVGWHYTDYWEVRRHTEGFADVW